MMDDLDRQLDYLEETKSLIKEAIENKGQTIQENDTFRSYVSKINAIATDANIQYIDQELSNQDIGTDFSASILKSKVSETINKGDILLLKAFTNKIGAYRVNYLFEDPDVDHYGVNLHVLDYFISAVMDTSDATATAEDIIYNEIAYVNGQKVTGNLQLNTSLYPGYVIADNVQYSNGIGLDLYSVIGWRQAYEANSRYGSRATDAQIVTATGLTADKLKKDYQIFGLTGTYESTMKEYASEAAMNTDIDNIANGEVVKVVAEGITTFYVKETTMKKLVKEEDTLSPEEYQEAIEIVDEINGEE